MAHLPEPASQSAPVVSILMANYQCAAFLPAALASIQAQTLADWELIVADDGSTDASRDLVAAAAAADPRIRLLTPGRRQGPAAARNRALAAARGEWVAVMDSDDLMAPDRLARLLAEAMATGARIVADNQRLFWDDGRPDELFLPPDRLGEGLWIDLAEFVLSNSRHGRLPPLGFLKPLMAMRLIEECGARYDETLRIGEDYDVLARLLAHGAQLRLIPEPHYLYRKHSASISHRYSEAALTVQIKAQARFVAEHPGLAPAERHALARRLEALEALRDWERFVAWAKRGDLARAAGLLIRRPVLWPMLAEPLSRRLRRSVASRPAERKSHLSGSRPEALAELTPAPEGVGRTAGESADGSHHRDTRRADAKSAAA